MSILIDDLLKEKIERNDHVEINGYWYIVKGLELKGLLPDIIKTKDRVLDAIRVFNGTSFAVHYKEDEPSGFEMTDAEADAFIKSDIILDKSTDVAELNSIILNADKTKSIVTILRRDNPDDPNIHTLSNYLELEVQKIRLDYEEKLAYIYTKRRFWFSKMHMFTFSEYNNITKSMEQ